MLRTSIPKSGQSADFNLCSKRGSFRNSFKSKTLFLQSRSTAWFDGLDIRNAEVIMRHASWMLGTLQTAMLKRIADDQSRNHDIIIKVNVYFSQLGARWSWSQILIRSNSNYNDEQLHCNCNCQLIALCRVWLQLLCRHQVQSWLITEFVRLLTDTKLILHELI